MYVNFACLIQILGAMGTAKKCRGIREESFRRKITIYSGKSNASDPIVFSVSAWSRDSLKRREHAFVFYDGRNKGNLFGNKKKKKKKERKKKKCENLCENYNNMIVSPHLRITLFHCYNVL